MSTGSGRPMDEALREGLKIDRPRRGAVVRAMALALVGAIKEELSKPGRGRIRRDETERKGKGGYKSVTLEAERITRRKIRHADGTVETVLDIRDAGSKVRKRKRSGVAFTDISGASRASAPGDPPAVDEGDLRNSIAFEIEPSPRDGFPMARVGSSMEKAPWLEYGTVGPEYTGGVIAPRPFMRPAIERTTASGVLADAAVSELQRAPGQATVDSGTAADGAP